MGRSKMTKALLLASLFLGLIIGSQQADASSHHRPKGFIRNLDGNKCWFLQNMKKADTYFHSEITANTATLVFDDPKCMSAEGWEADVNIMMINNFIAYPYSHRDAAFMSRPEELREGGLFQIRGKCIQSAKYALVAVAVDYIVEGRFIVAVKHSQTLECK